MRRLLLLLTAALTLAGARASSSPRPTPSPQDSPSPEPTRESAPPPGAKVLSPPRGGSPPPPVMRLSPERVVNGGVTLVLTSGLVAGDVVTGSFEGEALPFAASEGKATALLGVDLDQKPGSYAVVVRVKRSGRSVLLRRLLPVDDAHYPVQHVNGVPPDKVNPTPENLKRIERDQHDLASFWWKWTPQRYWEGSFQKPVPGVWIEEFGGRRVINGEERAPHSGIDQRAPEGTPIRAINAGRVCYVGDQFLSGNVTLLDHGQGLYSMYMHQAKVLVRVGEKVAAGEVIGLTGATGRVTGPHIHWGIRVAHARVDPKRLLALDLEETRGSAEGWAMVFDTAGEAAVAGSAGLASNAGAMTTGSATP